MPAHKTSQGVKYLLVSDTKLHDEELKKKKKKEKRKGRDKRNRRSREEVCSF